MNNNDRQKYLESLSKEFTQLYFNSTSSAVPEIIDIVFNNKYGVTPIRDEDASIEITFPALLMWYTIPMRNLFDEKDVDFITEDILNRIKVIGLDPVIFETNFKGLIKFFDEYFSDLSSHRAGDWLLYCLTENQKASNDENFLPLRLQIENILIKSYPFDWTEKVKKLV